MIRSYRELNRLSTFEERFRYLKLQGTVGAATFGFDRYLNQRFYRSVQWKGVRDSVILRDNGCDLGVEGYDIFDRIYIHHMNPMTKEDLELGNADILNPEYLICVTQKTHNAIHYGDESLLKVPLKPRNPGDTRLW